MEVNSVRDAAAQLGSQAEMARMLGVTEQAVCNWVRQGFVPMRRAQELEALTGIPRANLVNPRIRDLVLEFSQLV